MSGEDDVAKTVGCIILVVVLIGTILGLIVYLPQVLDGFS